MQANKTRYAMRHLLLIIFIIINPLYFTISASQHPSDSLLHLLNLTNSSPKKILIYRDLADIYLDSPEAKMYLLKMYHEALKINDKENALNALNDIIIEELNTLNKDSLSKYINYTKKVASPEELKHILPFYHMRIFEAQCFSDQRDEAIEKELDLMDSKENTNNIYKEITTAYTIGTSFYINQKYKEATPYLEKGLKLTESLPAKVKNIYQKRIIWKLSMAYAKSGKKREATQLTKDLINTVEQEYKRDYQKQRPFYNIDAYRIQYYSFLISNLEQLTPEEESYYWGRILQIGKKLTNDFDKYNYYLCTCNYYTNSHTQKDLSKAITAGDSLIRIAKILAPQNLPGLFNTVSQLYEKKKDYPNALKYYKNSYYIQDSLSTNDARQQLNELQVKYDVNTLNSEKAALEIKNKKTLIISLSTLLILVIGVCSYLYFSLKKEKRMKAELKVLNRKAQESEKMKQAFINSICHEIRTPLNSIVGFSDLIMNEDIDEEMRREFPAEIQKSTLLLTGLVNSMLEVANLDISEDKLPCEPTDIRNICIQEIEKISPKLGIKYQLDIAEDTLLITTNAAYLTMVIEHLLNNANKFTEKGFITLGYKVNHSNDQICISVADSGCGIPKEKQEEVFNRFSKLDTFVPGNGLGLYLCRLIVKRLDGEIKIDPDYTEGTRVIVNLPKHE